MLFWVDLGQLFLVLLDVRHCTLRNGMPTRILLIYIVSTGISATTCMHGVGRV